MAAIAVILSILAMQAAPAPGAPASNVQSLVILPLQPVLDHRDDRQRIVIMAQLSDDTTVDVTAQAAISCSSPGIVEWTGGILRPVANGQTTLTAAFAGATAATDIVVKQCETERPISFRHDVQPVLMKAGCNSGACHGSAQGKNGFRLSLFGFEPEKDYISLTRDFAARRIDVAQPALSLMLRKPTGEVAHEGGQRLTPGAAAYDAIVRWIAARAPNDPPGLPTLTGIEMLPHEIVVCGPGRTQQLVVRATYSDGADRDVTDLTIFDTTDATTASVSGAGLITSGLPGEAFVMARFGTFAVVTQVIVRDESAAFTWTDVPAANLIDEAIYAKLKKLQVHPSQLCSDETFLRRVFLDIAGVLPSVDDYRRFVADPSPDKRARLIDALLQRPKFPELWAMKWAEMLRIESTSQKISFKAMYLYNAWLRASILADKPMNQMVRELLTAEGGNFSTPAANFYMVETEPALIAENVAQVFAGIRIQCAQCHNHPFERWTQDDYYSFAAFFAQIGKKPGDDPRETVVYSSGGGEVTHLRTGRPASPAFLGAPTPQIPAGTDRRRVLADWLTAPDNPYFAACFVDRVWAQFFGRGLVDPPDDVRVSNPPSHPELRQRLARRLVESHYNLRDLVRLICNSRTYQLSSQTNLTNARDTRNFSHALVRRLPAEILLDAVCAVTGVPEKFSGLPLGSRAVQIADARAGSYFLDVFGRPPRQSACTCERRNEPTLSQALHLINGQTLANKIRAENGRLARMLQSQAPPEQIIEDLYVAALSRRPTEAEASAFGRAVSESTDKRQALEDIYWAVLNSQEFVFTH